MPTRRAGKHAGRLRRSGARATIVAVAGLSLAVNPEEQLMKTAIVLATVGTLGLGTIAAPTPAEAYWRGGWGLGFGPALAGGLIAGAVIGGLASSAYGYGPGYYGGYGYPAYYGGYGGYGYPAYYGGYGYPAYYGGYAAPAYYGGGYYGYRRVIRPAYYGGW